MKWTALCIAAGVALAPAAVAQDVYTCKVTDMVTAPDVGHDLDFEAANKRKTYVITDNGDTVLVEVTSPDYTPTSDVFPVIDRSSYEVWAQLPSSIGMDTLMLSTYPNRDGVYKGTVAAQFVLFVNSWHLECSKSRAAPAPKPRDPNKPDWQN